MIDELREHVAEKIGAIARPDRVFFTAELPKTRSAKIMRRLLRDIAEGACSATRRRWRTRRCWPRSRRSTRRRRGRRRGTRCWVLGDDMRTDRANGAYGRLW